MDLRHGTKDAGSISPLDRKTDALSEETASSSVSCPVVSLSLFDRSLKRLRAPGPHGPRVSTPKVVNDPDDAFTSVLEVQSQVKTSLSEFENRITLTEKKVATMTTLSKSLDEAHETIKRLVTENDSNKQFSMMNNLEISGIPYAKGENLLTVLRNISTKVGYSLGDSDVDVIHRVRRFHSDQSETQKNNRPPAVIVRFTQRRRKNELLAAVRARRGLTTADIGLPGPAATVYVGDHLTPANKLLLKQARQLRLQHNYTFLWIRDCKIFIRKTEQNFYDGEFFDNSFDVFRSDRSAEESGAARGGGAAVATGLARAAACSL
ncbi:hypothetical protein MSG28_014232 [Choristoneura fumiferana]|uniref:Uncharacterized protein n=1 Tax=Choristoneura fumiferana TaxID=7141 RepID=A0ACC0JGH4_CHOFU|nr:hypothetical protein MSG28_014232 [Choristoneura fumiferana]